MPMDIHDWKRRANLLAYFWSRVREEDWCGWYTPADPQYEWCYPIRRSIARAINVLV